MEPNSNYTISTEKDRYTTEKSQIKTKKNGGVVDQKLGIYGEGDVFTLKNIYYSFDRFDIRKDAVGDLNKVVALMKKNPTMVIELRSHTDSRADASYNQTLSDRRAKSAVDYIAKRGISRSRLIAKGYGESELLNECADGVPCSETEHQLNRRTEFKILKVQ
jgi:outer membrane protein OmpA-like peptidoglycan-associated protein